MLLIQMEKIYFFHQTHKIIDQQPNSKQTMDKIKLRGLSTISFYADNLNEAKKMV